MVLQNWLNSYSLELTPSYSSKQYREPTANLVCNIYVRLETVESGQSIFYFIRNINLFSCAIMCNRGSLHRNNPWNQLSNPSYRLDKDNSLI